MVAIGKEYFNQECKWRGCKESAVIETPLDYPRVFVCIEHYNEHKRLARGSSFGKTQRKRYLKLQAQ